MPFIHRAIEGQILKATKHFAALILTGPRRSGKTTLLRKLFPHAAYYLLEDPDLVGRVRSDPRAFMDEVRLPAIFDEVQNAPEILNYIRTRIDRSGQKKGQWLLTGSQEAPLMRGVTESMAGRAALFQLFPMSQEESSKVSVLRGGYPEVLAGPSSSALWFRSYIQTYLERDVRAITAIRDLSTFRRFLSVLASRCGQMLNKTDLAAPLGVSVPTISEWLNVLEMTCQIILVPPFYENFGKRLVKSPKIYFTDSGLVSYLLGIGSAGTLRASPFFGSLFEGFVASEIVKHQVNSGGRKEVYYFRDQQGLEVDFIIPGKGNRLLFVEAKASRTVTPGMAGSTEALARKGFRQKIERYVVYDAFKTGEPGLSVLKPGVKAISILGLSKIL